MCGINGGYKITKAAVDKMVSSTMHRGPDATGVQSVGSVTFGHNRLSIIDTSAVANQPMLSPDGRHLLVFNGEIYNFKALRSQLPDWEFKSQGDSEVLLAALATWGESAVDRIEGIFAFAWYDADTDELVLVRDHLGVKPLYYSQLDSSLFFSSELTGLIAGSDQRILDTEAVSQFLTLNYVPSPDTLVLGIKKLRPGHLARFSKGKLEIDRYFHPIKPSKTSVSKKELVKTIGSEVTAQMVSDRPLGVFLSGGLDSSIVLHHASEIGKIKTFSSGFEMVAGSESETEKFNADATLAAQTASIYGSEHSTFSISLHDVRSELLSILGQLDEPVSNPTTVTQFFLSRFVRKDGVVVALGGDGGDELWGGYERHAITLAALYFQKLPNLIQSGVAQLHSRAGKLQTLLGPDMHSLLMMFPSDSVNKVLRKKISNKSSSDLFSERYAESEVSQLKPFEKFMRVDRESWLADDALHRTDRSSMAVGVEVRVPLLGLSVVNLADGVHDQNKLTPLTTKKILRNAYRGHLPDYLFSQPKRGWLSPGAKWLRDPIIEQQVRLVFSDSYYDGLSSLINWPEVQNMLSDHIEVKGYHLNPLWNLLTLQVWAHKNKIQVE
ncbi:MAG: asparagine synthase (glutamine-hydrolyzing) [Candidatus Paceibacteria bacterium]|jgi:asparagine synthase (glutamine-hydrolysing)